MYPPETKRAIVVARIAEEAAYGLDEAVVLRDRIQEPLQKGLKTTVDIRRNKRHFV